MTQSQQLQLLMETNAKLTRIIELQQQGAEYQARVDIKVAEHQLQQTMLQHELDALKKKHTFALDLLKAIRAKNPEQFTEYKLGLLHLGLDPNVIGG